MTFDPFGAEVLPGYEDGLGISNIPPTIFAALTGKREDLPPLDPVVLPPDLLDGVRAVVLLVVDGLGYDQLRHRIRVGDAPGLARLAAGSAPGAGRAHLSPITSVFPSTTVTALTTLNTGAVPHRHGMLGYELYLPQFGQVSEMIRWGPAAALGSYADPELGAADASAFVPVETVYQRLGAYGVSHRVVLPERFRGTPLTQMMFRGSEMLPYQDLPGLFDGIDAALALAPVGGRGGPAYIYAYWGAVDLVAHQFGPLGREHAAAVAAFDRALTEWLERSPLPSGVLLMVTADHGHVATDPSLAVVLNYHHDLLEHLIRPPAGEARARYLYVKPGRADAVREYVRSRLAEAAYVMDGPEALDRGLFGPGRPAPEMRARVGDLILLPIGERQIHYGFTEEQVGRRMLGCHGGLAREEMLVPLLAVRS